MAISADAQALILFESKKKSVLSAYLLWFFLGGFGAHRFYMGKIGSAVGLMVLNLFGWLTLSVYIGFLILAVVGIWLIIDAIRLNGWVTERNAQLMNSLGVNCRIDNV
jgi:TM2 domain-containing membrane protein YozV